MAARADPYELRTFVTGVPHQQPARLRAEEPTAFDETLRLHTPVAQLRQNVHSDAIPAHPSSTSPANSAAVF